MLCPECSAELLEGAKFCSSCGAAIRAGWPAEAVRGPKLALLTVGAIVIGLAALGVIVYALLNLDGGSNDGGGQATPAATAGTQVAASSTPRSTATGEGMVLGRADAPVTIYEYSDFQCPHCRNVAVEVVPRLDQDYLATGKARLLFKNFAFLGQESVSAAEAAACASEQGKFWEYHNTLFENQKGENKGAFKADNLKRFAQEIGLDEVAFNTCFDEGKYKAEVVAERSEAQRRGVNSVPTFFVGQTEVDSTYDAISKAIEDELKKQGGTAGG